jgi:hypothetical protein
MKRFLLFTLVISLFAVQANADMYKMDAPTAAGMRLVKTSDSGDVGTLDYVGYRPGGILDRVYGTDIQYGAGEGNMYYQVGFTGLVKDNDASGVASVSLGLIDPVFPDSSYDGFLLPVANDDDDTWQYRAYVTTATGGVPEDTAATLYSGWSEGIGEDERATLVALTPGLDYSTVTGIGFEIRWAVSMNGERIQDVYSTSVVPVPAAVILGILGMGVAGLKLRKFA